MSENTPTLDLGAFKHVVVPIGVVIALGVARIVTAVSHYIQHPERVRASYAHAVWSIILFLWFVGLWWISWGFRAVDAERWSYFTLIFLLIGPSLMYLATTLLLPDLPAEGTLVLANRFEEVGRPFFASLAGVVVWLASVELLLLDEALLVPKRANQAVSLALLSLGALFPGHRAGAWIGTIVLTIIVVALATIRARLA